jgi:hypothetical protein
MSNMIDALVVACLCEGITASCRPPIPEDSPLGARVSLTGAGSWVDRASSIENWAWQQALTGMPKRLKWFLFRV